MAAPRRTSAPAPAPAPGPAVDTTSPEGRLVYRGFLHYNKARPEWGPLDTMLVHFQGRVIPAPHGVECRTPTRSAVRPEQPRIVMEFWASTVTHDSTGKVIILP